MISSNLKSQMIEEDFETTNPKVKVVEVKSDKLEMGYEDQYISESHLFAFNVNGVYINYKNKKWFIPFNRIKLIEPKEEIALMIYLKEDNYN